MTQNHITHDVEIKPCSSGHRARHIHDFRCLRAGGGHFVECVCAQTQRHGNYEAALGEWHRMHAKRGRPRKVVPQTTSTVLQFPLQLQGEGALMAEQGSDYIVVATGVRLIRRQGMFQWRGHSFSGLVDSDANVLYDDPADSFAEFIGVASSKTKGLIALSPIERHA